MTAETLERALRGLTRELSDADSRNRELAELLKEAKDLIWDLVVNNPRVLGGAHNEKYSDFRERVDAILGE